jgi:sulfate adenylyltransferase subunit 2
LYNARSHKGENIRAFPISNWTEMDVWQYIEREKLALPSIYFAHQRDVVMRGGSIVPVNVPLVNGDIANPVKAGEDIINMQVRFRTVGDIRRRQHRENRVGNRHINHHRTRRHPFRRPNLGCFYGTT